MSARPYAAVEYLSAYATDSYGGNSYVAAIAANALTMACSKADKVGSYGKLRWNCLILYCHIPDFLPRKSPEFPRTCSKLTRKCPNIPGDIPAFWNSRKCRNAILDFFVAHCDKGCDEAARARQVMLEMGVAEEEEGTMRWGAAAAPPAATSPDAPRLAVSDGRGSSTTVEGTAYAVLALVRGGDASAAYPAARYLLLQRNALGGFRSTQDTVVALEAGAYTRPLFSST
jgi:hypothetical protein